MNELKDLIGNGALVTHDDELLKIIGITEIKTRSGIETLLVVKGPDRKIGLVDLDQLDGNYDLYDSIDDAQRSLALPASEAA